MEAIAHARFQRYGSRKVEQVLEQIRGQSVQRVQEILILIPRRSTKLVGKTLLSAAANLQVKAGKKLEAKQIFVSKAWVVNGPMSHMKRVMPAPMGRAMTFKRKVCHLTVVVSDTKAA